MKIRPVHYWIFLAVVFCLYYLPVAWLGKGAYYNAFDTLDSYVVWYRMVMEGGYAWSSAHTIIPQILGGIPKFTLVNSFGFYYLLNVLMPTFQALNTLMVSASLVALTGMWLLTRRHAGLDRFSASFIALSFGLTPFLPAWTMSIAGQPMLLYVLLNLRRPHSRWWNWVIISLFPFVSNFQSAGIFILGAIGLLIAFDFYKKRPVAKLILASGIMLVLYSLGKIDLVANLVGGEGFTSHRSEMERYSMPLWVCFKVFVRYFLYGNIDVALSLHTVVLLPLVLGVSIFHTWKNGKPDPRLAALLLTITGICLYIAALNWEPVVWLRNQSQLLKMYSMERFHIFLQLLWHLAAARSLWLLEASRRKQVLPYVFAAQMIVCFAYQPTYYSYFVKPWVRIKPYHYIYRYGDYYAEATFAKIRQRIGKPVSEYKVGSIGIPPAVAQYNGMWTIDGYVTNYPLTYKHAFRPVIADELSRNSVIKGYFDGWGSQCILLYDQGEGNFNTHMTRDLTPPERDTRLNGEALKALGCRYVLSAESLKNPGESGLVLVEKYHSALWDIILYQVK